MQLFIAYANLIKLNSRICTNANNLGLGLKMCSQVLIILIISLVHFYFPFPSAACCISSSGFSLIFFSLEQN